MSASLSLFEKGFFAKNDIEGGGVSRKGGLHVKVEDVEGLMEGLCRNSERLSTAQKIPQHNSPELIQAGKLLKAAIDVASAALENATFSQPTSEPEPDSNAPRINR